MRRFAGILIGVVLLAAACSGGVDTSHDQAKADATVLKASDLDGFEAESSSSSSSESSSSSDPADECFRQATGLDPNASDKDRTAKAEADFKKGSGVDAVGVHAEVELHTSGDSMTKQLAAFSTPQVASCLKDVFTRGAETSDTTFSNVEVTYKKLDGLGDEGGEFDVSGTATVSSINLSVGFEIDFVRKGRVGLSVFLSSLKGRPDHQQAIDAFTSMLARVKQ